LRILFYSSFFEYRGGETYYTEEINSLIKNYPNVKILVYSYLSGKNCVTRYSNNILWIERRTYKNFLFIKDMIKIFTKFKPTIIHSVYVVPSIVMGFLAKIFRVPSILHGRGTDINYFPFISFKYYILAKIACMINKKILTVSKNMKQNILRLNKSKFKICHIYDGVDFLKFNPKNKNYYSKNRTFEILHVGRFSPEKCHFLIVETCKKLRDNNYNFHLTLIGFGPLENQIRSLIQKYNLEKWITITGYVDHENISNYYEKADLYIQPSITEGMPISVLEAMSMKLPVILTNVGGMLELIKNKGGIIIEKNNLDQLFKTIILYINNSQKVKNDGEINRKYILENFNWDKHAKKLYNIYSKLMK